MALALAPIDVSGMERVANDRDIRRDLHLFVTYVRGRSVKRSHRSNEIPTGDCQKLARLLGFDPPGGDARSFSSRWIRELDDLAHALGITAFRTEGEYAGYSSREPSYPENYMKFQEPAWTTFVQRPPVEQESEMLRIVLESESNEFFNRGVLSRLDRFDSWGSTTGVMPHVKFPGVRTFLLDQLARVPPGTWLETAALVAHLKKAHPYLLIPKETSEDSPRWAALTPRLGRLKDSSRGVALDPSVPRYRNFREGEHDYGESKSTVVPDDAPDGFERVEGRYVERFLEGLPLALGYVDVAYAPSPAQDKPSRGRLRAFRVHERLRLLLAGTLPPPKVTVQPDFQVLVESLVYPLQVFQQVEPLGEVVSLGPVSILRLRRDRVVATRAADPGVDPVGLLQALAARPLPQNVATELAEWTGRGDAFTIYQGFGLLECDQDVPAAMGHRVETIAPGLHVVRNPQEVYQALERAERIPLRASHTDERIVPLPARARTIFPKQVAKAESKSPRPVAKAEGKSAEKAEGKSPKQGAKAGTRSPKTAASTQAPRAEAVVLERRTWVSLRFPEPGLLEQVGRVLLQAKCPVRVDMDQRLLSYDGTHEAQVLAVLEGLAKTHPTRVVEKSYGQ